MANNKTFKIVFRKKQLINYLFIFFFLNIPVSGQRDLENPVLKKLMTNFGLYESPDHTYGLMLGMMEQYPVLFFPDGRIRGVFDSLGKFMIGNTIGRKYSFVKILQWKKNKKEIHRIFQQKDVN